MSTFAGFINGALDAVSGQGRVLQMVTGSSTTALATSTTIPFDDSVPQISEGVSLLTSTITPLSSTSTIVVSFQGPMEGSVSSGAIVALFRQGNVNSFSAALAANISAFNAFYLEGFDSPGVTSLLTYEVRFGSADGSGVVANNFGGLHKFGAAGLLILNLIEVE